MNFADDVETVPLVFTVEAMVEHFADQGEPGVEQLGEALGRLGRNDGPALLFDLHNEGLLSADAAAAHTGTAWSMAEYPDAYLDHESWRWLFSHAGYTHDGKRSDRPAEAVRLYRGSVPERRADWSWTDRRDVAERYAAGGLGGRPAGQVWTALVEPWRLLCRNDDTDGRNEAEYVVDTDGLQIEAGALSG